MPTLVLDSVPVLIFIMWYIWLYARNVVGMRPPFAAGSAAAFLLATLLAFPFAGVLHGAFVYAPGLVVTLVLGLFHARERRAARFALLAAAGVYFAALFFRTIDNEVCPVLPNLLGGKCTWTFDEFHAPPQDLLYPTFALPFAPVAGIQPQVLETRQ